MRIPDDFVATLRSSVPIADVISDYVDLKPQGALLVGLCPLHTERTPSFKVRTDYQRFNCYGCGESGDVFTFLQRVDGLDFRDAVHQVADRAGLTVPADAADSATSTFPDRAVRAALTDAHTVFQRHLNGSAAATARTFLTDRRFDRTHSLEWELGYNPANTVRDELRALGHSDDTLLAAGLIRSSRRGGFYDRFADRLIWPLHDRSGRLCGFAGRALTGDPSSKYVNSDDSPIYHKGSTLFGLWAARKHILAARAVIVVEGYTDTMAFAAAGHRNVVATNGTAVTSEQAQLLAGRVGEDGEVITAFDNDKGGRDAAWRAFLALQHITSRITAVDYSSYGNKADACDVRTRDGESVLTDLVSQRVPLLQLLTDHDCVLPPDHTPEDVAVAARHIVTRLRRVQSPILRRAYLERAATTLRLTVAELTAGGVPPTSTPPAPTVTGLRDHSDRKIVDRNQISLAAHLIDDPHQATRLYALTESEGLHDLFAPAVATVVELSWSGYPQGRPRPGSDDASVWGEFMAEVIDSDHRHLLWDIAFHDGDSDNVDELAVAARRTQLRRVLDTSREDPNRIGEYTAAFQLLRRLRTAVTA